MIIILAVVMGLLVAMELGLRSLFGFGNPLIQDKTISSLLMNSLTIRRK
ncbi:lipolytic protein G-D-S-L family, partial [Cuspidothrix issatschenkoi CHARLIE-1]